MKPTHDVPVKWEIRFEDSACVQIFKFDRKRTKNGPVSVETTWKQWILDEWENGSESAKKTSRKK